MDLIFGVKFTVWFTVCLYFRLKENNIPHNFINLFKIQIMETIIIQANAKKSQSHQRIFKNF